MSATHVPPPRRSRIAPVMREGERVTPLELFFDLVFVLALTQCTTLMARTPTWVVLLEGLLVLAILWWSWVGYAWLTSVIDPEEGAVRLAMFAAMAALLVAALCVPGAFGSEALLFACAYGVVRAAHIYLFGIASRDDPALRRSVGIALLAAGLKRTLGRVEDPLALVPAASLLGGAAIYLLAHVAFRLRNVGTLSRRRLVCSLLLIALVPVTVEARLSSLATLGVLAAVLSALIAYEVLRFAEARERVRHGGS